MRDLLIQPTTTRANLEDNPELANAFARMSALTSFANSNADAQQGEAAASGVLSAEAVREGQIGLGAAFIGGGCCVHLSVEYTPAGTSDGVIAVLVQDSYDTELAWLKKAAAGLGYQIKEGIVTTKPGAHLTALVVEATARVRWCEVFSCC